MLYGVWRLDGGGLTTRLPLAGDSSSEESLRSSLGDRGSWRSGRSVGRRDRMFPCVGDAGRSFCGGSAERRVSPDPERLSSTCAADAAAAVGVDPPAAGLDVSLYDQQSVNQSVNRTFLKWHYVIKTSDFFKTRDETKTVFGPRGSSRPRPWSRRLHH